MAYGSVLTDTVQSSTAGTPPTFKDGGGTQVGTLCRAWVNLNSSGATGAIRASFNVSSVTYNSAGKYTVNFTSAFADTNYIMVASCGNSGSTAQVGFVGAGLSASTTYNNKTTSAYDTWVLQGNNAAFSNQYEICLAFFR